MLSGISSRHPLPHPPVADLPMVQTSMVAGGGSELHMHRGTEGGGS